jgi:CRP-like cAMP-binding protein
VVGAVAPAGVLASWRRLRVLDRRLRVRDADIALLQRVPLLRPLPEVTIERLAARLTRTNLPAGVSVFEQGDEGADFYLIERGRADVLGDGHLIDALGPGDGFGEIALLRTCQRTTSVRATTALTLCRLHRTVFVAAVAGYSQTADAADTVIADHLASFGPTLTHD